MKRWVDFGQVAISTTCMERTRKFYEDVLGYAFNSKTSMGRGKTISTIQRHKKTKTIIRWLSDRSPGFHLELFEYANPVSRPMARDARPCDIGYRRMGIWVDDFDATLNRIKKSGASIMTEEATMGSTAAFLGVDMSPEELKPILKEHHVNYWRTYETPNEINDKDLHRKGLLLINATSMSLTHLAPEGKSSLVIQLYLPYQIERWLYCHQGPARQKRR